jgi:hypothetical protein
MQISLAMKLAAGNIGHLEKLHRTHGREDCSKLPRILTLRLVFSCGMTIV